MPTACFKWLLKSKTNSNAVNPVRVLLIFSLMLSVNEGEDSKQNVKLLDSSLFDQYSIVFAPYVFGVQTVNSYSLDERDAILDAI